MTQRAAGERQGPVAEAVLRGLLASGTVAAADLVWSDDLPEWKPAGEVFPDACTPASLKLKLADASPGAPARPAAAAWAGGIPDGLRGWTKFGGVMNMITGILACLSCFGLVQGEDYESKRLENLWLTRLRTEFPVTEYKDVLSSAFAPPAQTQ